MVLVCFQVIILEYNVNFTSEHKQMLTHLHVIRNKNYLAIPSNHDKLITSFRTTYTVSYSLEKEQTRKLGRGGQMDADGCKPFFCIMHKQTLFSSDSNIYAITVNYTDFSETVLSNVAHVVVNVC